MSMKEILLVGGPGDGTTVTVGANDNQYRMKSVAPDLTLESFLATTTAPVLGDSRYVKETVYDIAFFGEAKIWVGLDRSLPSGVRYDAACLAITKRDLRVRSTPQYTAAQVSLARLSEVSKAVAKSVKDLTESVDDGLTHITIKTSKPDKWRFFDLETGETWRWDTEADKFVKVTYDHD